MPSIDLKNAEEFLAYIKDELLTHKRVEFEQESNPEHSVGEIVWFEGSKFYLHLIPATNN